MTHLPDIHRLLPQAGDAEHGVLCSILLSPREIGGLCVEKGIRREHFHVPANATIYSVLLEMQDGGKAIDVITLTAELRDRKLIDQCGGVASVTDLFTFLPTAANAEYYIGILEEKFTLREIIRVGTEYAARSYDEQGEATMLLDQFESKVLAITRERYRAGRFSIKQVTMDAIHDIEKLYETRGAISGLSTGFSYFDKVTDGLHGSELFVIAARPSMGKTAFAMNIAEHIAVDQKRPVAVFSLEMSTRQLMRRLLCSRARVDMAAIRAGLLSERDFPALTVAASKTAESRLIIDDTSGISILELKAKARRLKDQQGIAAIVVDYIGLMKGSSKRSQDNRQLEISEISAGLKDLSKELDIPVVALAQLNRNPESRGGEQKGRPRLSDLRESGSIEQDADIVGLLYREEYYADGEDERKEDDGKATLIIAKQRNGPVCDVPLTFRKAFARFENRAMTEQEPPADRRLKN